MTFQGPTEQLALAPAEPSNDAGTNEPDSNAVTGEFPWKLLPECPPDPRTCWRACRRNLLWHVSPTGGMIEIGDARIVVKSNGHTFTKAENAQAEDHAVDELLRLRAEFMEHGISTCSVDVAIDNPDGMQQHEAARILRVKRQTVQQEESKAFRRVKRDDITRRSKNEVTARELHEQSGDDVGVEAWRGNQGRTKARRSE